MITVIELSLLFGLIGTVTGIGCYVPQIIKSLKTKSMKDFHLWYLILLGLNVLAWLCYGIVENLVILIIANGIDLGIVVFLIVWKMRCKHKKHKLAFWHKSAKVRSLYCPKCMGMVWDKNDRCDGVHAKT